MPSFHLALTKVPGERGRLHTGRPFSCLVSAPGPQAAWGIFDSTCAHTLSSGLLTGPGCTGRALKGLTDFLAESSARKQDNNAWRGHRARLGLWDTRSRGPSPELQVQSVKSLL